MGKNRFFVLSIDLESEVSGILDNNYLIMEHTETIESLLSLLKKENVKLSVFVVGEVLKKFPKIVDLFEKFGVEFHCHSYSHSAKRPDSEEEISKCKFEFEKKFGKSPIGYRAPQGKISKEGIKCLEKLGFKFDSSIFPSYYPNPFKYLFKNRDIFKYKNADIIEIPFTSVSPFRFTFSLSFVKLLGRCFYKAAFRVFRIPDIIVFGFHLHDLVMPDNIYSKLPLFWKVIYYRNRYNGLELMKEFINYFNERDYKFVFISDLYKFHKGRIKNNG